MPMHDGTRRRTAFARHDRATTRGPCRPPARTTGTIIVPLSCQCGARGSWGRGRMRFTRPGGHSTSSTATLLKKGACAPPRGRLVWCRWRRVEVDAETGCHHWTAESSSPRRMSRITTSSAGSPPMFGCSPPAPSTSTGSSWTPRRSTTIKAALAAGSRRSSIVPARLPAPPEPEKVQDYNETLQRVFADVRKHHVEVLRDMAECTRMVGRVLVERERDFADEAARQRELTRKSLADVDLLGRCVKVTEYNNNVLARVGANVEARARGDLGMTFRDWLGGFTANFHRGEVGRHGSKDSREIRRGGARPGGGVDRHVAPPRRQQPLQGPRPQHGAGDPEGGRRHRGREDHHRDPSGPRHRGADDRGERCVGGGQRRAGPEGRQQRHGRRSSGGGRPRAGARRRRARRSDQPLGPRRPHRGRPDLHHRRVIYNLLTKQPAPAPAEAMG
jgi:hypothetical protein